MYNYATAHRYKIHQNASYNTNEVDIKMDNCLGGTNTETRKRENINMTYITDRIKVEYCIVGTYHTHKNCETTLFNWDTAQAYIVLE